MCIVRGVLGYYGRATPIGRKHCEMIDKAVRTQLNKMGFLRQDAHNALVFTPKEAGGMGFERAWSVAAAAFCDEIERVLAGKEGEPSRASWETLVAITAHRLGFESTEAARTPLDWMPPPAVQAVLSEELLVEAWWIYLKEAGLRPSHTGAHSDAALGSWRYEVDAQRNATPHIWEELRCPVFSRRLAARGIIRIGDVYAGNKQYMTYSQVRATYTCRTRRTCTPRRRCPASAPRALHHLVGRRRTTALRARARLALRLRATFLPPRRTTALRTHVHCSA